MSDQSYKELFPEKWMCPYCSAGEYVDPEFIQIPRDNIPQHLVYHHDWDFELMTWKYIYERLSIVGGV